MSELREAAVQSWAAAQRRASVTGELVLTAPSAAGMLLMAHGGDIESATLEARMRIDFAPYWARVTGIFDLIRTEEGNP